MIKREQKLTTKLIKWLQKNWKNSGPVEVKVSKTHKIYKHQFADHQIRSLRIASESTFVWKIPDARWQNPFDVMIFCRSNAYVALIFNADSKTERYTAIVEFQEYKKLIESNNFAYVSLYQILKTPHTSVPL